MVGFAGVFLVIRPGFNEFQIETLYALCAAVSFAVFLSVHVSFLKLNQP